MTSKLLLITGANKGIGYAIAEATIQKNLPYDILLCSRDQARGQSAISSLQQKYPNFKQNLDLGILDVSSAESITTFTEWFKQKYSKVDILLNNAGILYRPDETETTNPENTIKTFDTNYFGTVNFAKEMQPMVSDNGKILFMGSICGPDAFRQCSDNQKLNFLNKNLSPENLNDFARQYIKDVVDGEWKEKGYCVWEYAMSKLFIQVYVSALARSEDIVGRGVQCYTMHPGVIATDINHNNENNKPVMEGVRSSMKLIEKEFKVDPVEQGGFFHEDGSLLALGEAFEFQLK